MSAHRSPRGGEVAELARLLPVPAERDLPDGRMLLLREHLMAELRAGRGPGVAERGGCASRSLRAATRAAFPPRSLGAPSSRLIARQENSAAARHEPVLLAPPTGPG